MARSGANRRQRSARQVRIDSPPVNRPAAAQAAAQRSRDVAKHQQRRRSSEPSPAAVRGLSADKVNSAGDCCSRFRLGRRRRRLRWRRPRAMAATWRSNRPAATMAPPQFSQPLPGMPTDPTAPEEPEEALPALPINVNTEETQTGRFMFGVGVNSNAGLVGSIVVDEQNFDWQRWPNSVEDWRNGTAFRGARPALPHRIGSGYANVALPGQLQQSVPVRHQRQLRHERLLLSAVLLRLVRTADWAAKSISAINSDRTWSARSALGPKTCASKIRAF